MPRRLTPPAAALLASCAVRPPADEELFHFEMEGLGEPEREKVRGILRNPSSVAPLRETRLRSPRAVYQFLFENQGSAPACAQAAAVFGWTTEGGCRWAGGGSSGMRTAGRTCAWPAVTG